MIDWAQLAIQPPPALSSSATDAQKAEWRDMHRICASYAHAWAQAETAAAMQVHASTQAKLTAAIATPEASKPFRRIDLFRALLTSDAVPSKTGDNGAFIGQLKELVDDLVREIPGIVDA